MSGIKKLSETEPPKVSTSRRPSNVPFPSVKDLKAKFATTNESTQQIISKKKDEKTRHSYAHGNSNLQILTGPQVVSKKPTVKTPTTPTTPSIPKVKTYPNPLLSPTSPTANGFGKQNGSSSDTTPTTPTKLFQSSSRSSVILHVQAGGRVTTPEDNVEIRKKSVEVDASDNVKRLTSRFNDLHETTSSTTTRITRSSSSEVEIRKKVEKTVIENQFEEAKEIQVEEQYFAAENDINVEHSEIYDFNNEISSQANDDDHDIQRQMSTPSSDFLQSMTDHTDVERQEFEFEDNFGSSALKHFEEPEIEDRYESSYSHNDEEEIRNDERDTLEELRTSDQHEGYDNDSIHDRHDDDNVHEHHDDDNVHEHHDDDNVHEHDDNVHERHDEVSYERPEYNEFEDVNTYSEIRENEHQHDELENKTEEKSGNEDRLSEITDRELNERFNEIQDSISNVNEEIRDNLENEDN